MARVRSVDFLPEIFQTDANKQFLAATLDQLIQEPKFKKTQGYIGQTVGPGVNPNDKYVIEPSTVRNNYQLEPGVISLDPTNTEKIQDAITYPGINDALEFQGAVVNNPQRLYKSDYYTWDPFVDFDALVNFNQYYWVPAGPDVVSVYADAIPLTQDFTVTRSNGVYTFSGAEGNNPTIELVRGGNYTFQISNNAKETVNFRVQVATGVGGASSYQIDYQANPTLTLARGNTYIFTLNNTQAYPFWIKTEPITGPGSAYNSGVTNNGGRVGTVTFVVPQDAPDTLYYSAENATNLHGQIDIVDSQSGTGPGFWIQTFPGITGTNPSSPNLSTRDVFGVTNNGEDLGTISFAVPSKTAQQFYYDLTDIGGVDLFTNLAFDDIDGANLADFIDTYGGIDGITDLENKTLVFNSDTIARSLWQITYVGSGSSTTLSVTEVQNILELSKFTILFGAQYSNTQWYKDNSSYFEQIPLLSAIQDILYYQDGTDPEIFGRIKLVEQDSDSVIDIDAIVGQKNYTSPNGVAFTNGLKVKFLGNVVPATYGSGSVSLVCTSTISGINIINCDSTQGLRPSLSVVFTGSVFGGISTATTYYVNTVFSNTQFTVSLVPEGPTVSLTNASGEMAAIATALNEYYIAGVGTAIELLPVNNFVVPETYATDANDDTVFIEPSDLDYITINRASKDLNAWSRSNRWFHIDVLNATATYNGTVAQLDNNYRGKRPIIQFRGGLKLFNMGTQGLQPVNAVDFTETDALSNVEGSTEYTTSTGYELVDGSRIVFAADDDPNVRNKIYVVNFVTPDTVSPLIDQPIIHLVVASDGNVVADQSTVCTSGTQAGTTFWYDGVEWLSAQQKEAIQQAPLFNVYDANGFSFANRTVYPSSTFTGSKLFSYAIGTGVDDPVLQFKLQYQSLNNIGDIVFDNNLYTDTFNYVSEKVGQTKNISDGYVYEYATRTDYTRLLGWQNAVTTTQIRQQFKFSYDTLPLLLDVAVLTDQETIVPAVKVFVGSKFQSPDSYSVEVGTNTTSITLFGDHTLGDIVEVLVLSNQISNTAFYQVPDNLSQNPLNNNSSNFTLGTVRTHYGTICENLTSLTGTINGSNNSRDLGNLVPYGQLILQQSSPLTLAGYFMRSSKYNIFAALDYNNREYQKYKNQLLEAVTQQTIDYENQTTSQLLDVVIDAVIIGRTEANPFYWSDMIPGTQVFTTTNYTVSVTTTNQFNTLQVYDYTTANFLGMNVYLNNELLTRGVDYFVSTVGAFITLSSDLFDSLVNGDVISLQEYTATYGSYVPNTPTKLGLYPAWEPQIISVKTSSGDALVIVGHDGSQTPVFNDIRDDVLLEFEKRIYNNLKLDDNPVPLEITDVLPGQFRSTDYSYDEVQNILLESFLSYVGWNKLDYTTQDYNGSNSFTFNYSQSQNKLDNQTLLGAWRGIYRYFYDTQQPEVAPWEMLGFTVKPSWWEITYGPAPYTKDNLVLWNDLEAGLVRDPVAPYIIPAYIRPGLIDVIPTGSEGELLSPLNSVVGVYPENSFQKSWAAGDGGPVEASWWNSSNYPFAVMRLLALTKPAEFFALFADRDLYRFNNEFGQYLYNDRYRLDANGVQVYGNGVSKASYINWIVDYNKFLGRDSTQALQDDLANLDVRLCYRMASFSDKQYIKLYTEKSTPSSTNTSLLIPDESYDLLLYKNQPFSRSVYSSVVIQVVENGWAVYGYSTTKPFFSTLTSVPVGQFKTFSVGGTTISVPANYTQEISQVPYGFVFATESAVANFLLSYGKLLEQQGFVFDDITNGYVMNWDQMVQEFLYWADQGWGVNTLINLNPVASKLSVTQEQAIVDSIVTQTAENILLDQNRREFATRDLNIVRIDNTFTIEPLSSQSLSYLDAKYTNYENMIVLNNTSLFGDVIYIPTTGTRQSRLYLVAATSTEWNGSVDAQGFILNQNNIEEWTGLKVYAKGEIVKYKGAYWSAATIVQPGTKFNYNDWNQSDYTLIQQGLLPNLANKADQLQNSYNINSANLESDNDLLSYGLIGYRPRQYLAALNLDDVSQLNIYRQFLDSKGTVLSADLLGNAKLNKEVAEYTIYENWAILRGTYGANANRSFVDLRLNRALLTSNPVTVQIVEPQQSSQANQSILVSDVWKSSFRLTGPNILPTTYTTVTDVGLPTAGYVNLDDADITVFQLSDPASLNANINQIKVGTSVWVAKVNDYNWNIYRAQDIPGKITHVCDNLNGTSRVIFSQAHGLSAGATLIIKYFDTEVNGVYKVLSVSDIFTANIALTLEGGRTVIDSTGVGFTLQTMRVDQASDILNLSYAKEILPGAKVWVDNNGSGHWEVLEKTDPFTNRSKLAPLSVINNGNYGTSLAQAQDQAALFVGSPGYVVNSQQVGGVYVYLKGSGAQYTPISPLLNADSVLLLNADDTRGFGNSLDFGNQTWGIAGASASLGISSVANNGYCAVLWRDPTAGTVARPNPFVVKQVLTIPDTGELSTADAKFGHSVAISQNERWIYISAPGLAKVYAYELVEWTDQFLFVTAADTVSELYFGDNILIDNVNQISVSLNDVLLTYGADYTVDLGSDTITFTGTVPVADDQISIQRLSSTEFTGDGSTTNYDVSTPLYGATNVYSFSVNVSGILQRPNIDYYFSSGDLIFYTAPAVDASIVVVSQEYYEFVNDISVAGVSAADQFGWSLACSTSGDRLIVGAKDKTVSGETEAGAVYVFDRNIQKFIVSPSTTDVFTLLGSVNTPVSVTVNNQRLIDIDIAVPTATNTYSVSGNQVTIYNDLNVGDVVEIDSNQFVLEQTLSQNTVANFANFGYAIDLCPYNCSLYVGAPQSSEIAFKGGVVERDVSQDRVYGTITSTVANPSLTIGDTLRVNNVDCVVPAPIFGITSLQGLANNINSLAPNAQATVSDDGFITISVRNTDAAATGNKLQVSPGSLIASTGTYSDLGFEAFVYTQSIASPIPTDYSAFGGSLAIDDTAENLVIGSPQGTLYLPTYFDYDSVSKTPKTTFDGNSTVFLDPIVQSGAVYTFDYFPSSSDTIDNPGKFVFGQQISNSLVRTYDNFGYAVAYNSGALVVGAPYNDFDTVINNSGSVWVFQNVDLVPAWSVIRQQQPVVDIHLLNSVFMYDRITTERTEFFDFFDPLQGKILGAAQQNLDYIGAVDPAFYNTGAINNIGKTWKSEHVGEMWWDTSTVRFIDPNQDDIVYASRRWGQVFPGSSVDVYQWVESSQPPAAYVGSGQPRSLDSYVIETKLNREGLFVTSYYFWVRNVIETYHGKSLSASIVSQYIENPRSSGISYVAPLNASTIAIYNGLQYVNAFDTVISVEFDQTLNDANIHTEYELVAQDRPSAFISDILYQKLQDSFCGTDQTGALVPDPNLPASQRYGVQIRPRQSMFVDRFEALKNYIVRVNSVLSQYPISEIRSFALLDSQEPVPSATIGAYDLAVANLEILSFQDIYTVPLGYKYLVESDSNNRGLWTIYTVETDQQFPLTLRRLVLSRVQNYKTSDYWSYIDWYLPGYNSSTTIRYEVSNYANLATLSVPVGTSAKVTANAQGKFEIYLLTDLGWNRVGLEDGTIEISETIYNYQAGRFGYDVEVFDSQYFDEYPSIETRKIIQAINEQLLIDDLLIFRNRALVLMFNYILSEQQAPEWLTKTSLIDVNHRIRELVPFENYIVDNQDFVLDYLQEVKPYHVQIREFNLNYNGADDFLGDVTDFDIPAYYNTDLPVAGYVSPILTNDLAYTHAAAQAFNTQSDAPETDVIWSQWPYNQWFDNYLLSVESITVVDQGSGYTEPPVVTIIGNATESATATAVVNSLGRLTQIIVDNPGSGYQSTPQVLIESAIGSGALAYPVMGNGLVRSIKTIIKFDRNQYQSTILTWSPDGTYENGTLVRYNDQVYEADNADGSSANVGPTFNLEDWVLIPAEDLSGADRTMGYYVPSASEPGLQLSLLIDGVDYPGVQVYGKDFDDPQPLDAIYESFWGAGTLTPTGTAFTDINVEGGEFIGPYEGHAPEELVNGAEFDTVDIRVYTRPGSDWDFNGHGFQFKSVRYTVDADIESYSWADVVESPVQVLVSNVTTGLDLIMDVDYTVDWVNKAILITDPSYVDNIINITVYETGGGSQLFRQYYTGEQAGTSVIVPVSSDEIYEVATFVNGLYVADQAWEPWAEHTEWSVLNAYNFKDVVTSPGGAYFRAIQDVPAGIAITNTDYWLEFTPTLFSKVTFTVAIADTDGVAIVVMGDPTIYELDQPYDSTRFDTGDNTGYPGSFDYGNPVNPDPYNWSTAQDQYITSDGSSTFTLTNSVEGTNPANLVITKNGLRLLPPAGIQWIGDDSSTSFGLPQRMGVSFSQSSIVEDDITVWINSILQVLGVDYNVTAWTGSNTPGRQVVFTTPPAAGDIILISVSTIADYTIDVDEVTLSTPPNIGDNFVITTWNDTQQQEICTLVFVGPDNNGTEIIVDQPYDNVPFSSGSVNNEPGSYDYSEGVFIPANNFYLDRPGITSNRLWVTLDGYRLFEGVDFTVEDNYLILGYTINSSQKLAVTEFTQSTVPDAMAFRIFQDMRGGQAVYRITESTTAILSEPLLATADEIFVDRIQNLSEPNMEAGIFGVITINGERIMYRSRNIATSSVSSLLRGTAGTAAASHAVGAFVYDMGRGNLMPEDQDYIQSSTSVADGITDEFVAANIEYSSLLGEDSTINTDVIEVYVAGVRQLGNYSVGPDLLSPESFIATKVTLNYVPTSGVEVTILVRRGTWWYDISTAYNRTLALQETDTRAARFLRGQ